MINKCKFLTNLDTSYISQIAGDIQSGNHLLRPRSEAYWEYWNKMVAARKAVLYKEINIYEDKKVHYDADSIDDNKRLRG